MTDVNRLVITRIKGHKHRNRGPVRLDRLDVVPPKRWRVEDITRVHVDNAQRRGMLEARPALPLLTPRLASLTEAHRFVVDAAELGAVGARIHAAVVLGGNEGERLDAYNAREEAVAQVVLSGHRDPTTEIKASGTKDAGERGVRGDERPTHMEWGYISTRAEPH